MPIETSKTMIQSLADRGATIMIEMSTGQHYLGRIIALDEDGMLRLEGYDGILNRAHIVSIREEPS
jgi:hypothetical protein